jgi:hypothetical protein
MAGYDEMNISKTGIATVVMVADLLINLFFVISKFTC